MTPEDGPRVSVWDVTAATLWVLAAVLLIVDVVKDDDLGDLSEVVFLVTALAVTITVRCIAQRHLSALSKQMRDVFEYGRDYERSTPVRKIR